MKGFLNGISVCSPQTYSKVFKMWPKGLGKLTPDPYCPNHVKLKGRGQKKLYAIVYVCREDKVDKILIEGIYDWRKK